MTTAPTLTPRLTLASVVTFGVAYMSPAIVMLTFGVIASASGGATPSAYVVATLAMSLTALSYGKMSRIFPASGSAYTYASRMIGPRTGFLAGWAILLDYFFLPMVAWLIQSVYLNAQFPIVPVWGWLVINVAVTTLINVLGIVLADRVNKTLMTLTALGIAAFVVMCLRHLGAHAPDSVIAPVWNSGTSLAAVSAGAAIAAYSFLGFDAVSTLSEETIDPGRTIPRGILLTVLAGGVIFVGVSFVMQLVHPGGAFEDPSTASYTMSVLVGGQIFADVVNIVVIVGGFASGLAIQASTSRLMFVMGRDGVLPRRFFGRLHPRLKTPVLNLLLVGVAAMLAVNLAVDTATSFINFGAFLTFATVNGCVIVHFVRQYRAGTRLPVLGFVVLPALGALVDLYLLTQLGPLAIALGVGWLVLGTVYLAVLTRGFRKAPPSVDMDRSARTDEGTAEAVVGA
ncbi:amino acid permease [Tersicoccus solisilvae]|uniref:Amino acid permease n=1 Tax=Tersicoccus solisilvae TaxID=1882339 RepID=A0ABQ1PPY0_9MICC|nr:APC family permease [Tersicoccus solisilvae]GGD00675.1 amino acid permease [Tersicoccus solisilvae]